MANKSDSAPLSELLDQLQSLSTVTETFTLPTEGKLDGINSKVTLRMMTTHEEKMRTGSKASFWKTIATIIDKCIVDPIGISSYDLTAADFIFLMYKLRIVSYGEDYKVNTIICPHCDRSLNNVSVDLDKLKVTYISDLKDGFSEPFEIELPKTKWKVKCRLLRMREIDSIQDEADKILKEFPKYEGDPAVPLRLAKQIITINDHKLENHNLMKVVDKLPAEDENAIMQTYNKITMGLDLTAEYKCPHCGKLIYIPLSYTEEFFRPSVE